LAPVLNAVENRRYMHFTTRPGIPSTDFLQLAERRLHVTLNWSLGDQGALEDLGRRITANEDFFLRVLELAIERIDLGYNFQEQAAALAELDSILTEAGSVWRVDIQRIEVDAESHGHKAYREIRTLQRRTSPEAVNALQAMTQSAPAAAPHLTSAWNYAFGRNPNPTQAYSEAIKAVEAAAIPVVSPNDLSATLGKVLGQLRNTPQKWQVVLTEGVPLRAGGQMASIEVITNLTALLWENHTDRHAPVQPIQQAQAEMAVHLALSLVQIFTRSVGLTK
jgi:hypothetical protein